MPAYYTVVQYVPDIIMGERINAGVIAFDGDQVKVRFVRKWSRIKKFANYDIRHLQNFFRDIEKSLHAFNFADPLNEDRIREMASKWGGSIQFTSPRGSLLSLEELIEDVGRRFLIDDFESKKRPRDKRHIRSLAHRELTRALRLHGGEDAVHLLRRDYTVRGKLEGHPFDLAIANGQPKLAAGALSFEIPDPDLLDHQISAAAWSFQDVRERYPKMNLAAVVFPGDKRSKPYQRATDLFDGLGVEVVEEAIVSDWADLMATQATHGW